MADKARVATVSLAGCFGCHMSILDIDERIIRLADLVEFDRTPITDIKELGHCDVGIIEGGVCNAENVEVLREFRCNCTTLVAIGACAINGGIPAMRNQYRLRECLQESYIEGIGVKDGQIPNDPEIPLLLNKVHPLHEVVKVDYFLPGCPPVAEQVAAVLNVILEGKLPAPGAVVGVGAKTNCDVCTRKKRTNGPVRIKEFKRPHEIIADPEICFLEQGLICAGPATRSGCGLPCIQGNMPCRGCYGPPEGVTDQGAKLLSAIAAIIDAETAEDVERVIDTIVDPLGTYYRFNLSDSILSELKYG